MFSLTRSLKTRFLNYASELRFPRLAALTAVLFLADLVFPDFIPLADEILLGLFAAMLAVLKKGRRAKRESAASAAAIEHQPDRSITD